MAVLFLYHNPVALPLADWLRAQGEEVVCTSERLTDAFLAGRRFTCTVSYTYRYLLTAAQLQALGGSIVNLHMSYLPWNRGAYPHLWSVLEGTPRGVTIHFIDERVDKGSILAQRLVPARMDHTLQEGYAELDAEGQALFRSIWPLRAFWDEMKKQPLGAGTYHSLKDTQPFLPLTDGWSVTAGELRCRAQPLLAPR